MTVMPRLVLALGLLAAPAMLRACETALLLAIDVSHSVDTGEYRLQTTGLAEALRDPAITEILQRDSVAIAVLQWAGTGDHALSVPWQRMADPATISAVAEQVRGMERAFVMSGTATGTALQAASALFAQVPDCKRRVIDISTDGIANGGADPRLVRQRAERAGITINGIGIESMGLTVTNYLRSLVITRDGFVMTARRHEDYPRAIREKILRELARVIG